MIPLRDINPTRRFPFINYALIALNLVAFVLELGLVSQHGTRATMNAYALVPVQLVSGAPGEEVTLLTSMFMHGGWEHLLWNMVFLWIFGDNVEDALGHVRYLIFYLGCGLAAAGAHIAVDPASAMPLVGASGAIAGVLGAYVVLHPWARIVILNPFFPLWFVFGLTFVLPAWIVVGEWFVGNLLGGLGSLGARAGGGVAFFAHIGGFLAGLLAIRPLTARRRPAELERWSGWRPPQRSSRAR